ncbi:PilW family protein [Caballeronia mineralivorans]|jgi:type IV pilus assembly protein PilW|uniref:PilW family protein n=1 Tax=Caballeronia mineralivorans TaxID=2010198 RepID=UPI002AFF58FF|nr:PilW family protein [Caballeronia mineralivorans]MEA3097758.1 type pilus assembly protein PilW [Caballeronia mineralivorans]
MNTDTQRGFTLVELMIAVLIALFLIGGLLTLVQAMKSTSLNQNGLSQLQESERMAVTLMTDVIQSAGYFPLPLINTAASSFPVSAPFTTAGQTLFGSGNITDAAPGNSITVRYQTNGTASAAPDNVINCLGNTSGVAATFVNTFSVDLPTGTLQCTLVVNGLASAPVQLISGVNSLQIYYGVQTNTAVGTNSIDAYLDAATVTAGNYWSNVKSVKIKLTFVNPLFGQAGQTTAGQFITFTRIVDVMNKTGVTT